MAVSIWRTQTEVEEVTCSLIGRKDIWTQPHLNDFRQVSPPCPVATVDSKSFWYQYRQRCYRPWTVWALFAGISGTALTGIGSKTRYRLSCRRGVSIRFLLPSPPTAPPPRFFHPLVKYDRAGELKRANC
eukprot:2117503-Pyramimonas_sp.AAC.1